MIQFVDVVKSYEQGNNALNGATLQVEDGEFVFLIGPSGSGKSTIIKLITGEPDFQMVYNHRQRTCWCA